MSGNLQELLRHGATYAPHYLPSYNSNHLPMTLIAMSKLGATDALLEEFHCAYSSRLHESPVVTALPDQWRSCWGERDAYPLMRSYFLDQLSRHGIALTVGKHMPSLLSGIALDAFHPIIRLGYAVDSCCELEVAASMAYMTVSHVPMPVNQHLGIDLEKQLSHQTSQGAVALPATPFSQSLNELAARGLYPVGTVDDMAVLAKTALRLYQTSRNFFALHLVTATQALRVAMQGLSIQTRQTGIAAMTGALLASHIVLGSPTLDKPLMLPMILDKEHAIKYAWACLSEYRHYGDATYLEEIDRFRNANLIPSWVASED